MLHHEDFNLSRCKMMYSPLICKTRNSRNYPSILAHHSKYSKEIPDLTHHGRKRGPAQCKCIVIPGIRVGTKGLAAHDDTLGFSVARHHKERAEYRAQDYKHRHEAKNDGVERSVERPTYVLQPESGRFV